MIDLGAQLMPYFGNVAPDLTNPSCCLGKMLGSKNDVGRKEKDKYLFWIQIPEHY